MELHLTTELDAVNVMLKAIGETPIETLDDAGLTDASIARDVLAEVTREVLSIGFYFNTDDAFTFALDVDGKAAVPTNVLSMKPVGGAPIVPRAGFLYDRSAQSDVFDADSAPVMEVRWLFDFETIPETARRYITIRAARIFQDRVQGSESIHSFNKSDEEQAEAALIREDDGYNTANTLSDTQDATDIWSR
jgi:hypothetical protein